MAHERGWVEPGGGLEGESDAGWAGTGGRRIEDPTAGSACVEVCSAATACAWGETSRDGEMFFPALLRCFVWLAAVHARDQGLVQIGGPHTLQPQPIECG